MTRTTYERKYELIKMVHSLVDIKDIYELRTNDSGGINVIVENRINSAKIINRMIHEKLFVWNVETNVHGFISISFGETDAYHGMAFDKVEGLNQ